MKFAMHVCHQSLWCVLQIIAYKFVTSMAALCFLQYYPEGTIISSGMSKWASAGGWRVRTFCVTGERPIQLDLPCFSLVVIAISLVVKKPYQERCFSLVFIAVSHVIKKPYQERS